MTTTATATRTQRAAGIRGRPARRARVPPVATVSCPSSWWACCWWSAAPWPSPTPRCTWEAGRRCWWSPSPSAPARSSPPAICGRCGSRPVSGLDAVLVGEESSVVGRRVAVPLVAGAVLTSSEVGNAPPVGSGSDVVAVGLKAGSYPPDLAPGDRVQVVPVASSASGEHTGRSRVAARSGRRCWRSMRRRPTRTTRRCSRSRSPRLTPTRWRRWRRRARPA